MQEWILQVFEAPAFAAAMIPAAVLLGLISSLGSCCNYGIMAAVAGYAGSREELSRRQVWLAGGSLMVGLVIALAALGTVAGHLGGALDSRLGRAGTIAAAFVVILFGLAALQVIPFRIPSMNLAKGQWKPPHSTLGAAVFGLAVGVSSISCNLLCCVPLLPVILGLAVLQGKGLWGAAIMASFALGYGLPLTVMMLGVSFGKLSLLAGRAGPVVRRLGGVVMIGAGFWMLLTV